MPTIGKVKELIKTVIINSPHVSIGLWGPPGVGKCIEQDSLILDATTGELISIKDFDITHQVIAFVNGDMVRVTPTNKFKQGMQEVYRLRTQTGREILATANHPFLVLTQGAKGKFTDLMWKELTNLDIGMDVIATANNIPVFGSEEASDDILKLIGYLLGNGYMNKLPATISFTSTDVEQLAEFTVIANNLGMAVRHDERPTKTMGIPVGMLRLKNKTFTWSGLGSDVVRLLEEYDVKFSRAGEKEIPAFVFRQTKKKVALFLNRLFSTDGCVEIYKAIHKYTGPMVTGKISYSSKSKKMIYQIQHLLDRFGITSYMRCKEVKQYAPYYELQIMDTQSICAFNEIGFYGVKATKFAEVLKATKASAKISHRTGNGVYRFGILFDKVVHIESLGERMTYDLEIPVAHNFIASGLVVHNSSIIAQIAKEQKMKFVDIRLAQFEPSEIRGIPQVSGGVTKWARADFLPSINEPTILMFDEFSCAEPSVQNAALRIVLDRSLDNWEAPPQCRIILAGNRREDFAYINEPSVPFKTRLVNFIVQENLQDWKIYAKEIGCATQIISFLDYQPDLLLKLMPDQYASPTPRTWIMLSDVLTGALGDKWMNVDKRSLLTVNDLAYACVGEGAAVSFVAYFETFAKVDVKAIVEDGKIPDSFKSMELSSQYATVYAVLHYANKQTMSHKIAKNLVMFLEAIPPEFQMKFIVDIKSTFLDKVVEIQEEKFKPIIKKIMSLLQQK